MKNFSLSLIWTYVLLIGFAFLFQQCQKDEDHDTHSITSFTPTEGVVGTEVSITGAHFGTDKSQIIVSFDNVEATSSELKSVSDTEIKVAVPAELGTQTGSVKIKVIKGTLVITSTGEFTILATGAHTVTSFTPTFGKAGTEVTITGTQFGTDKSKITVSFGSVKAKADDIKSVSNTEIKVVVPAAATTVGALKITVQLDNKAAISKDDFSILEDKVADLSLHLLNNQNTYADPKLKANSVQPASDSPAATGVYKLPASVLDNYYNTSYTTTTYRGAVDPSSSTPWYAEEDWSYYSYLVRGAKEKNRNKPNEQQVVTDAWLRTQMGTNKATTLTANKYYVLDGHVFVQDGETLTIEAGTVLGGKQRASGQTEGALIIAKGGKIMAEGTASKPIIFTYDGDPLDGSALKTQQGRWGGVIILGKADLNTISESKSIEGIPTTEPRGSYGGTNDADNSGTMTYVSIRHGGSELGTGDEINGLTLGGVGHGTTLHHIEIIANKDDGIEFFGGTVGVRHLIVGYCLDDAFDYDQGYRGLNQFVILHLNDGGKGASERALECDGDDDAGQKPYALPLIANLTAIGGSSGAVGGEAMIQRANSGVRIVNSIFKSFKKNLKVEFTGEGEQDAWKRFKDGDISLHHNLFHDFDGVNGIEGLFSLSIPK